MTNPVIPAEAVEAAAHVPVDVAIMDGMQDATVCAVCGVVRDGWVESGAWPCEEAAL